MPGPRLPTLLRAVAIAIVATLGTVGRTGAEPRPKSWCAPEFEALSESVCYFSPLAGTDPADGGPPEARRRPRTLVFFLHPLVGAGSDWQWDQQRLFARLGKAHHFSVLMPHARARFSAKQGANMYTWPNSAKAQAEYEDEILEEWAQARRTVEAREGRFERVFVFGFSNGAYYATSLALRSRIDVDGYGVFAGGEALKFLRPVAMKAERRPPIFVGYGTKDPAHQDQIELVELLQSLGWPHRSRAANVGHMVTDDQLREALQFLGAIEASP